MSNYIVTYSTRKTVVIEDRRTNAKIELSPVSYESSKLLEALPVAIVAMQPIEKVNEILQNISGTVWEQSFMMFFFFWISDYYQEVLYTWEPITDREKHIKYLERLLSEIFS